MISALFGLFAVGQLAALVLTVGLYRRHREPAVILLVLVASALVWDNAIIALGSSLGEGQPLLGLSVPRYVGHALFTPLLIPFGVLLAARLGLTWFARRSVAVAFGGLTVALIGLGCVTEIARLSLEPTRFADSLRYVNAAAAGPPVPAIVAIIVLVAIGVLVWLRTGWGWLCAGAVVMFAAAAAGTRTPWLQNLGELALIAAVLATATIAFRPRATSVAPQSATVPTGA